jgi:hypothetical protein
VTDSDSPHGLLIRHFADWAAAKGKQVDLELLEELLHLRSTYDDLEATYWPLDSVEHLLLERWPAKGSVAAPDPEVLTDTLDAYFRFLRSTGRMSGRSGDPKALTKEARRAARRMPEAASDVANWSPTKVLMDFGRSIGIEVDDVPDIETMQDRLGQIQDAWNALPTAERQRRMPYPDDVVEDEDLTGAEKAMDRYGTHDPIIALLMTFADSLPTGELPPDDVVAPIVRAAPFTRQMLELAAWVGEGREITGTRVLRPALAHEAYGVLGLGEWTRSQLHRQYPDESLPGVAAVGLDAWIERQATRPWRSAADCEALHRVWVGAAACGLIEIVGKKARAVREPERDDERWVSMGIRSAVGVMNLVMQAPYSAAPLIFALMTSYVRGRRLVTFDEIVAFKSSWQWSVRDQAAFADDEWIAPLDRPRIAVALGRMADTGLYVETDDGITLTAAGDVFVTAWLKYMEG